MNKTKEQWENEILDVIKEQGGFSMWWIDEKKHRYSALERLLSKGIIVQLSADYPYWKFRIVEK